MSIKNIEDAYPLTPTQEGILFHNIYSPETGIYVAQFACRIEDLNLPIFERAWEVVIDRFAVLRTAFAWKDRERPIQIVGRSVGVPLEILDWRELSAFDQQARFNLYTQTEHRRPFNLNQAPLMRMSLIRVADDEYLFCWTFHHLLLDGWSVGLVFKEAIAIYEAFSQNREPQPERSRPYKDYIAWLKQQDAPEAEAFWQKYLKGFSTPTRLAIETKVEQEPDKETYKVHHKCLSPELAKALQLFARQHHLTLNTLVLGAWALLLSRYSGEQDIVIGSVVSGRSAPITGVESMVGLFINTLPVRAQVVTGTVTSTWLEKLQRQQTELHQYEHVPLMQIQQWSEIRRGLSLFDSILVFENYPVDESLKQQSWSLKISDIRFRMQTNYAVALTVMPRPQLLLQLGYHTRRFESVAIDRVLGHLVTLLEDILENPGKPLEELRLLTKQEQRELLEGNSAGCDYPADECVHRLFENAVEANPNSIAVVFGQERLTYRELNSRANQVAHHLRSLGVEPGVLVGLFVERSLDMLTGLLGILKAGGAYLSLSLTDPQQRLAFILEDTQLSILLTQQKLVGSLPECETQIVCMDSDWETISLQSASNPTAATKGHDLAYLIYTSGTTGKPKAVMVEHKNLVNTMLASKDEFGFSDKDVMPCIAAYTFDIFLFELLNPLLNGGRSVLISHADILDINKMVAGLENLTAIHAVPSYMRRIVDYIKGHDGKAYENLKLVFTGGDLVPPELLADLLTVFPRAKIYVLYGPTEGTLICSKYLVPRAKQPEKTIIGTPLNNVNLRLYDQNKNLVPVGVAGEIYIGGAGVTRGYWKQAELTQERYISIDGQRYYGTGDLGRYLEDRNLEFLGRLDNQVKIHGFRIESGEIEAALSEHEAISQAVVTAHQDGSGDKSLLAYIVVDSKAKLTSTEIRAFLKGRLPEYMLPSSFIRLDSLPLTPTGKVDRRALPAPDHSRPQLEGSYVAPRDRLEQLLAEIWSETLEIDTVGIHDDFFELGGNSIKAVVLTNKLQKRLDEFVYVVAVFEAPTIERLAEYLRAHYPEATSRISGKDPHSRSDWRQEPGELSGADIVDEAKLALMRELITPLPPRQSDNGLAAKNPPAIFILSPPRCGSTLLRVMLGGHPGLFAPPELELLSFNRLTDRKIAFSGQYKFWLEGAIRAIMQIKGCDAEIAEAIMEECEKQDLTTKEFYRRMQQWLGAKRLVDKTPSYALDLEILRRAEGDFEAPLYIHLLRNPCAMIRSFQKVKLDQVFFIRKKHKFSTRVLAELIWVISQQNILEFLRQIPADRQHRVKFEELVSRPRPVLESLSRFLNIDFDEAMLRPYEDGQKRMTDGAYPLSKMVGDVKFHQHHDIDSTVADAWREDGTTNYRLGDITRQVATLLGYEGEGSREDHIRPAKKAVGTISAIPRTEKGLDALFSEVDNLPEEEAHARLAGDLAQIDQDLN